MYKSILVPIDLAHESSWKKAVPVAKAIADTFKADLHVVTVVPDVRVGMVSQYFPADFEETSVRKAAEELQAVAAEQFGDADVTEHVHVGNVYRTIVKTAKDNGCDLIVMASHRPEITDILIGPNADQVARHTTASVMIVRS